MRKKQWENGRGVAEGDANEDSLIPFPSAGGTCCGGEVVEPDAGDAVAEEVRGVGGLIEGVLSTGEEARDGIQRQKADEEEGVADDRPFRRLAGLEAMAEDWDDGEGRVGQRQALDPVHIGFGHSLPLVLRAVLCQALKVVMEEKGAEEKEEEEEGERGRFIWICVALQLHVLNVIRGILILLSGSDLDIGAPSKIARSQRLITDRELGLKEIKGARRTAPFSRTSSTCQDFAPILHIVTAGPIERGGGHGEAGGATVDLEFARVWSFFSCCSPAYSGRH